MTNDFIGLLSDDFSQFHIDMITEVIRSCSVDCTVIYGVSLYDDCPNCIFDPIGNKSSNRWQSGGPAPFTVGQCPMCGGIGKIANEETDTICMMPVYDHKSWIPTIDSNVQSPFNLVQTLSMWETTYDIIVQAKEVIMNTALDSQVRMRYEKNGKPQPCGFGHNKFAVTMWKRIENG